MRKFSNWENVKPAAERQQLPKGGYIVKILDAKVRTYTSDKGSFEKLEISVDIANGEFKDFYATDYRSQTQEDKRWRGVLRQYIPTDDGSEKDEWTKSVFKAMTDAIEDSNPGYHWDWNETGLKGKTVGALFRSEEWDYQGKTGFATRCFKLIPAEMIKSGKFKVPADKLLTKTVSGPSGQNFEEISSGDDLPF